jgi:DNA-binding beta-propeller fold protein YncE
MFFYSVYDVRAASTAIALRADGRFAYVLNTLTDDVTVVDVAGATALEKFPVGGREIRPLPTGRFLTVASDSSLEMLDTTTNAPVGKWELPGLVGLAVAPDRPAAVAVGEKSLVALDPATGKVTGRVDSFVGNADWRFVVRRRPPPAEAVETKPKPKPR